MFSCVSCVLTFFFLEETDDKAGNAGESGTEVFLGVCGTDAGAGSDVLAGKTGVGFDFGGSPLFLFFRVTSVQLSLVLD